MAAGLAAGVFGVRAGVSLEGDGEAAGLVFCDVRVGDGLIRRAVGRGGAKDVADLDRPCVRGLVGRTSD